MNQEQLIFLLRRGLAAFETRIEELRQAIQQHSETIHTIEEAKRNQDFSAHPMYTVVSYDEQTVRNERAENRRHYRVQNSIRWATWLAFFAVCFYAYISYNQWREMIGATDAASDAVHEARLARQQSQNALVATINQFRLDQRAWIGEVDSPTVVWGVGKTFVISAPLKNTGKTPGVDLTTVAALRPLNKGQIPTWSDLEKPSGHGVLQPSAITYITVAGSGPVTRADFDAVESGRVVLWFWGRITYKDVFGREHWTTVAQTLDVKKMGLDTYKDHNEVDPENPN